MLLSTMTYEEIYREIVNDSRELYGVIAERGKEFQKMAKRATRYPYGKIYSWTHPTSKNAYIYFFEVKRHSDWDKPARLVVYTEYDDEGGKTTIAISRQRTGRIGISIFRPHFFKRYQERNLVPYFDLRFDSEIDLKMAFLIRTSTAIPLGKKVVSPKELEKDNPELTDDSLLTPEGLILCKRLRKNSLITIFKTFLTINELFQPQYEEVIQNMIHVVFLRAINDSPRFSQSINKIYLDGISELNRLLLDPTLPEDEKQKIRMKRYGEIIDEFYKYII